MDVKSMYTRDFALDVCTRFANGETIDSIARSSGERKSDIEALLRACKPEMEAAFRQAAEIEAYISAHKSSVEVNTLGRIAAALERMIEILEHIERKGE